MPKGDRRSPRQLTGEIGWNGVRPFDTLSVAIKGLENPRHRMRAFERMAQRDPVVNAVLTAIEMQVRGSKWTVEPADDSPAADTARQFVDECLHDLDMAFEDVLSQIMSQLVHGFALCEIVWKLRAGPNGVPPSRYSDNRVGIGKLAHRPQRTIHQWLVDPQGGLEGAVQLTATGLRTLPADKLLLFRPNRRTDSYWGQSLLLSAYVPWFRKDAIEDYTSIGIERDLTGVPEVRMPSDYFAPDAPEHKKRLYQSMVEMAEGLKQGEYVSIVTPSDLYTDVSDQKPVPGAPKFAISLLKSPGAKTIDPLPVIQMYNLMIAASVLADWLMLGHENAGSWALSTDKTAMFREATQTLDDAIAGVLTRDLVPRLCAINNIDAAHAPRIEGTARPNPDLGAWATFLEAAVSTGILNPDPILESHVRSQAGLPPAEPPDNM